MNFLHFPRSYCLPYDLDSENQWSRCYKKKWMTEWGSKTSPSGGQLPLANVLEDRLLWRHGSSRHVFFHACAPGSCPG